MAITTTTISKAAGWARTDIVLQLEEAFTWLGWHGGTQTGIVTGISAYSGGGTVGTISANYYDVFQSSTTGIGTGASFWVSRSSGNVNAVYVNRPGVGYTDGEYVTLSATDIGGSGNGAVGIGLTVKVDGNASPVGYGSTTAFYDKDVTAGSSYPWGVLRHTIQSNKKFGDTYRVFQPINNTSLRFYVGSGFHPYNVNSYYVNRTHNYSNRLAGNPNFDVPFNPVSYYFDKNSDIMNSFNQGLSLTYSNSTSYQLDLNIFRSGIDPKFVVFSYRHPTLSSTKLRDNTYGTFILHNFTSSLWDYNNLFLGGVTEIFPYTDESDPYLTFRTWLGGSYYTWNGSNLSKRCAEFGYIQNRNSNYVTAYKDTIYRPNSYPSAGNNTHMGIYLRNSTSDRAGGGENYTEILPSASNFNAVIKGIPINAMLAPCPYYIPDDFVLIDFDYATPSSNIQQGDTITISGSEVYTVITGSYNQTTRTRGILFCARTV
jgi:hypothetical protein